MRNPYLKLLYRLKVRKPSRRRFVQSEDISFDLHAHRFRVGDCAPYCQPMTKKSLQFINIRTHELCGTLRTPLQRLPALP